MQIPLQLVVLALPSLICLAVRRRRDGEWTTGLQRVGWQLAWPFDYLLSLGVVAVVGALGWLAFQTVPTAVLQEPGVSTSAYGGWHLSLKSLLLVLLREAIYVALGEEIFFRGLLGGWLARRLGFGIGNLVQALVFLAPHLLLLMVSLDLWPILVVQAVAGWLVGWLRSRSGSILPGWMAHSVINALGALPALR